MSESTAKNLFKGGVESVSSGSWGPFVIAAIGEYLNAWGAAITPGDTCSFVSNPDKIQRCAGTSGESIQCFSKLLGEPVQEVCYPKGGCYKTAPHNAALSFGVKESFFSRGMGQKYSFPPPPDQPPCEQKSAIPNSCLYNFDAWDELVDRSRIRSLSDYSTSVVNDYWVGWKALNREERLSRYQYNARHCIDHLAAQGALTDDQKIAVEVHFGGRWSGNIFLFNNQVVDGKLVGQYAAWIPLGPNEGALRRTYSWLYFDNGLTLKDLDKIAKMEMTEGLGLSFDLLPPDKKRDAMAQAYIIEAVRAKADSEAYRNVVRRLRAKETQDLGWEPVGHSPQDFNNPGFTIHGKPHTIIALDRQAAANRLGKIVRGGVAGGALRGVGQFAQTAGQAVKAAVSTPTRAAVSGAVLLGVAGGSYWIWRKHGKKIKARFKKLARKKRRR